MDIQRENAGKVDKKLDCCVYTSRKIKCGQQMPASMRDEWDEFFRAPKATNSDSSWFGGCYPPELGENILKIYLFCV